MRDHEAVSISPFAMLADPELTVAHALDLPTFTASGHRLYSRRALLLGDGREATLRA